MSWYLSVNNFYAIYLICLFYSTTGLLVDIFHNCGKLLRICWNGTVKFCTANIHSDVYFFRIQSRCLSTLIGLLHLFIWFSYESYTTWFTVYRNKAKNVGLVFIFMNLIVNYKIIIPEVFFCQLKHLCMFLSTLLFFHFFLIMLI